VEAVKYFNVSGPCFPAWHYMVPTSLLAVTRHLTGTGKYAALRFSCQRGEAFGDDVPDAEAAVLAAITDAARLVRLPEELMPPDPCGASR